MVLDHAQCYRAVKSRDARFDGRFFSGVTTTGVYCRPICPAKTPKSENIEFYPSAAAAEDAGYRPCRRCRPEASPGTPEWLGSSAVVSRAMQMITESLIDHEELKISEVAIRLGMSDRQLRRLFEEHLGASPIKYAQTQRVHFAKMLVERTPLPITEIAFTSGFTSIRRFNNLFKAKYGVAPSHFRKRSSKKGTSSVERPLELKLQYRPPLDWEHLLNFFTIRSIPGVEVVENGIYKRTIKIDEVSGIIEVEHAKDENALILRVPTAFSKSLYPIAERVRSIFDLKADPEQVFSQLANDDLLKEVVQKHPGLRVPGAWDPFELAMRAVLGQQVTVKAATTLCGRLADAVGHRLDTIEDERLSLIFPSAEDLVDVDVKIGTPESRMKSIRAISQAVVNGDLKFKVEKDLDSFQKEFCKLPGIGPWTAHYFAMRALGEPDAFPDGDIVLQKVLNIMSGRELSRKEMIERAEGWRPWRAYATLHLWNHMHNLEKEKK